MLALWISIRSSWDAFVAKLGAKKVNTVSLDAVLEQAGLPTYAELAKLALYNAAQDDKSASKELLAARKELFEALTNLVSSMGDKVDAQASLKLVQDAAKAAGIKKIPSRKPRTKIQA